MLEHQLGLVPGPRAGHHQRLEERVQPAPTPLIPRLPSPGSLRSDLHLPNERLSLALDQLLGSRCIAVYGYIWRAQAPIEAYNVLHKEIVDLVGSDSPEGLLV